jgi:hypothetical protein
MATPSSEATGLPYGDPSFGAPIEAGSKLPRSCCRCLAPGCGADPAGGRRGKFKSRTMVDAPESGERVTEQLLDGQQRLTALWRSLHDKYEDEGRIYLIGFEPDPNNGSAKLPYVYGQVRWSKNGARYPIWVDNPHECWSRGFIPIRLLRPADILPEIHQWITTAVGNNPDDKDKWFYEIIALRDKVKAFNLPYLALPAKTPKEVALDVFVKMNSSSVRLSTYDIVVALVEEETGKSLHEHVEELHASVPRASEYADLPSLVLDVAALRQDRIPGQAGYRGIDYPRMINEWKTMVSGIKWMVNFLEGEHLRCPAPAQLHCYTLPRRALGASADAAGQAGQCTASPAKVSLAGFFNLALRAVLYLERPAGLPRIEKGPLSSGGRETSFRFLTKNPIRFRQRK